mmetsp:Transcript_16799/g.26209  ORF Transcript_16799/g.26209 Transcript_16799/m.26209 type:complete len:582 (+) Transcript_16799:77-1822(+)
MQEDGNISPSNNVQLWQSLMEINQELTNSKNNSEQAITHMRTLLNIDRHTSSSSAEKQQHMIIKCLTSQLFYAYPAADAAENVDTANISIMSVMDVYKMLEFLCTQFGVTQPTLNSYVMKYASADELEYQTCPITNEKLSGENNDNRPIVRPDTLKLLVEQVKLDGSDSASAAICALALRKPQQLLLQPAWPPSSSGLSIISLIMTAWRDVTSGENGYSSAYNSTLSIRYCALVINLAMQSDEAMQYLIPCLDEMMDAILWSDAASTDPLMQMSALDMLEKLASTSTTKQQRKPMHPSRTKWLLSKRMLMFLLDLSGGGSDHGDDLPDPILGAPALRLLSSLCRVVQADSSASLADFGGDELIEGFRNALLVTETSGELERLAFIDAVSSFVGSSSDEACTLILGNLQISEGWLFLGSAQSKMKAVIMNSIAQIIDYSQPSQYRSDDNNAVSISNQMIVVLLTKFGDVNRCSLPEILLSFARKPVMETKLAAYNLMRSSCKVGTILLLILAHAGFQEFLVNRETDATKEGKEAKFAVIEAIVKSDVYARGLVKDDLARKLDEIVKQGPHYVKAMSWQMMTE